MTVTRAMEVRTMEIPGNRCPQTNSSAENDNHCGGTASTVLRPASVLADGG